MICFVIAFLATLIGAIAGIGGGIIIKPLLDLIGGMEVQEVSVLSSFTVLAMAITSILKQIKQKTKLNFNIAIPIAVGSIIGGMCGEKIFSVMLSIISNTRMVVTQNCIMISISIFILFYMYCFDKSKNRNINNYALIILIGFMLGVVSSFLSIGGGPLNICILMLLFSMTSKEAARNSIVVILFTQLSSMVSILLSNRLQSVDLHYLPLMIIGGIMGGYLGSSIQEKISTEQVGKIFNSVVVGLIIINIINIIKQTL